MRKNEIYVYKRKNNFFIRYSMYESYENMPVHTHVIQAITRRIGSMENKNWNVEEKTLPLAAVEGERFDVWTDRIVQALTLFLSIVGIPFTIYVLFQFLFSL